MPWLRTLPVRMFGHPKRVPGGLGGMIMARMNRNAATSASQTQASRKCEKRASRPLDAFAVESASDLPQVENDALAWLRRAAAARDRVRHAYA
jgi:hypothetical protein